MYDYHAIRWMFKWERSTTSKWEAIQLYRSAVCALTSTHARKISLFFTQNWILIRRKQMVCVCVFKILWQFTQRFSTRNSCKFLNPIKSNRRNTTLSFLSCQHAHIFQEKKASERFCWFSHQKNWKKKKATTCEWCVSFYFVDNTEFAAITLNRMYPYNMCVYVESISKSDVKRACALFATQH